MKWLFSFLSLAMLGVIPYAHVSGNKDINSRSNMKTPANCEEGCLTTVLHDMGKDIGGLRVKVGLIQGQQMSLQDQLGKEKGKVSSLQNQLDQEKAKVTSLQSQVNKDQAKIGSLQQQLDAVKKGATPIVAFTVTRHATLKGSSQRICVPWQNVITNLGGGWDKSKNEFRAPISGLYAFHLTAAPSTNRWMNLYLVKNGRDVTTAHGTTRSFAQGSTHVALSLTKSDIIQAQLGAGQSMYGDRNLRPSFTGYLIKANP